MDTCMMQFDASTYDAAYPDHESRVDRAGIEQTDSMVRMT